MRRGDGAEALEIAPSRPVEHARESEALEARGRQCGPGDTDRVRESHTTARQWCGLITIALTRFDARSEAEPLGGGEEGEDASEGVIALEDALRGGRHVACAVGGTSAVMSADIKAAVTRRVALTFRDVT